MLSSVKRNNVACNMFLRLAQQHTQSVIPIVVAVMVKRNGNETYILPTFVCVWDFFLLGMPKYLCLFVIYFAGVFSGYAMCKRLFVYFCNLLNMYV